jgi:RNA polymerase-binding transcription factor DksA
MSEGNIDRKHLERRRAEILSELDRVNNDLKLELDRDPEEQAIQLEQDEVSVTMEQSLRAELDKIEEQLAGGSE